MPDKLPQKPMHVPPSRIERRYLDIEIPPSNEPTTVRIEVSVYQGKGGMIEVEPLLGDGLVPPDLVKWAGKESKLKPQEWKLLDMLQHAKEKRMQESVVKSRLWQGEGARNLKPLVSRLNAKLRSIDYPVTVERKNGWLALDGTSGF